MTPLLSRLWQNAPLSWAIIRASEIQLLSQQTFLHPILEVGCGDGLVSQLIFKNKQGIIDVGIDLNQEELRRAQKTGVYKKLLQTNICNTSFPNSSFNTIFANGVLEHISNLSSAIQEISRILKPGGKLITTSPLPTYTTLLLYYRFFSYLGLKSPARSYGAWINRIFVHHHLLSLKQWQQLFYSNGLLLKSHVYYNNSATIALHDIFLPLALGTKTLKLHTDQMVLFPHVRRFWIPLLTPLLQTFIKQPALPTRCGSILLIAEKRHS